MKSMLPRRFELVVFVVMALVAGIAVTLSPQRDTALFFAALPIFLVSALLGFRRSLAPAPVKETVKDPVNVAE